jgi:signal transduction histidine kinase
MKLLPRMLRFPFPFATYLWALLMVSAILFLILAAIMYQRVENIKASAARYGREHAQAEINDAFQLILKRNDDIRKLLIAWDETYQQLRQPAYYPYWHKSRLINQNMPNYLAEIELYNVKGERLAYSISQQLPANVPFPALGKEYSYLKKKGNQALLIYFFPAQRNKDNKDSEAEVHGYYGMSFDLSDALNAAKQFHYADLKHLNFTLGDGFEVPADQLLSWLAVPTLKYQESQDLEAVAVSTLQLMGGLLLALMALYCGGMFWLFGLPLRRLEMALKQARPGRGQVLTEIGRHPMPVAELDGLRRAVYEYQIRLDRAHHSLELQNHKIDAALLQSQAANRAKNQFLANIGHELRTPLNAIIGFSDIIRNDGRAPRSVTADIEKIYSAGQNLLSIINQLLDLAELESGKLEASAEAFGVLPLLHKVVSQARPLVSRNFNILHTHYASDLGEVYTDAFKLEHILLNLLANATKFTENGSILLEATRMAGSNGDWLEFRVTDSGIGIPPEKQDMLFQPFSQLEDSNTRRYGGAGLGLALTKRYTELLGGYIDLQSQPGVGSIFIVALPARLPNAEEASDQALPLTRA